MRITRKKLRRVIREELRHSIRSRRSLNEGLDRNEVRKLIDLVGQELAREWEFLMSLAKGVAAGVSSYVECGMKLQIDQGSALLDRLRSPVDTVTNDPMGFDLRRQLRKSLAEFGECWLQESGAVDRVQEWHEYMTNSEADTMDDDRQHSL